MVNCGLTRYELFSLFMAQPLLIARKLYFLFNHARSSKTTENPLSASRHLLYACLCVLKECGRTQSCSVPLSSDVSLCGSEEPSWTVSYIHTQSYIYIYTHRLQMILYNGTSQHSVTTNPVWMTTGYKFASSAIVDILDEHEQRLFLSWVVFHVVTSLLKWYRGS